MSQTLYKYKKYTQYIITFHIQKIIGYKKNQWTSFPTKRHIQTITRTTNNMALVWYIETINDLRKIT